MGDSGFLYIKHCRNNSYGGIPDIELACSYRIRH
jgi:hypothetical protein